MRPQNQVEFQAFSGALQAPAYEGKYVPGPVIDLSQEKGNLFLRPELRDPLGTCDQDSKPSHEEIERTGRGCPSPGAG